jgi:chromosome partitioning protein
MIVLVGGIKGGTGKTTVATNLAVMRANAGYDCLLVDADDQETATDFSAQRNERREGKAGYTAVKLTGLAVRSEGKRLASKYESTIIDTGGRDTTSLRAAIAIADVMLVPFAPRSFDLWSLEKTVTLVEEMRAANPGLRAYSFLNRADVKGADNREAENLLRENETLLFLPAILCARKAFSNASAFGLSVTELKPPDEKAVTEITTLYDQVFAPIPSKSRRAKTLK